MPLKGNRIPVKLPWKGITNNEDQFVSMKSTVAKFLGFDQATEAELEYKTKINRKNKKDGEAKVLVEVKRRRRPGYRQRSVKITFQTGRPAAAGRKSTIVGKTKSIGGQAVKSIQFPITKSVSINEVVKYFEKAAQNKFEVLLVTEVNTGQSYAVNRN